MRTVTDMGELPVDPAGVLVPGYSADPGNPLDHLPYSAAVAAVGLLESLMTASIVDDLTDTPATKTESASARASPTTATGFIGGMAGCAMIGQSMINVKSGGRGRLSTFCAGIFSVHVRGDWRLGEADPDGGAWWRS